MDRVCGRRSFMTTSGLLLVYRLLFLASSFRYDAMLMFIRDRGVVHSRSRPSFLTSEGGKYIVDCELIVDQR